MSLNCKTSADVIKLLKDEEIPYVDLRFTDPRGKWQHLTMCSEFINEDAFADGVMFDGSSIAGWKAINESDMSLIPDPTTAVMDPFCAQPMMILFCDIMEPTTGQTYGRDPRSIAKKAEMYLASSGIGDTAYFGSEAEFFVFDDVRFAVEMNNCFFEFTSDEGPYVSGEIFPEGGNIGHLRASRAATSRCRRWTPATTCVPKWSPSPSRWACTWTSTTTRWRRRSMSSA